MASLRGERHCFLKPLIEHLVDRDLWIGVHDGLPSLDNEAPLLSCEHSCSDCTHGSIASGYARQKLAWSSLDLDTFYFEGHKVTLLAPAGRWTHVGFWDHPTSGSVVESAEILPMVFRTPSKIVVTPTFTFR